MWIRVKIKNRTRQIKKKSGFTVKQQRQAMFLKSDYLCTLPTKILHLNHCKIGIYQGGSGKCKKNIIFMIIFFYSVGKFIIVNDTLFIEIRYMHFT